MYNPSGFKLYGFASITSIDIIFYTVCVCTYLFYMHAAENTDTFWSRGILQ